MGAEPYPRRQPPTLTELRLELIAFIEALEWVPLFGPDPSSRLKFFAKHHLANWPFSGRSEYSDRSRDWNATIPAREVQAIQSLDHLKRGSVIHLKCGCLEICSDVQQLLRSRVCLPGAAIRIAR